MAKRSVVVEQDKQEPVETKVLAKAIVRMSDDLHKLLASGLNRKAIVILTSASSGQPQYRVEAVLNALADLKRDYTA
jgi:hypothetical protein